MIFVQKELPIFITILVCIECGAVDEIQEDLLDDVEEIVEREWKFKIKDHQLDFSWDLSSLSWKEVK